MIEDYYDKRRKEMRATIHRIINTVLMVIAIYMVAKLEVANSVKYEELKYSVECNADSIFKILSEEQE